MSRLTSNGPRPINQVRLLRAIRGIKQVELSKLAGIPQSILSLVENDWKTLTAEQAEAIIKALELPQAESEELRRISEGR
jgi:hypothetical protein